MKRRFRYQKPAQKRHHRLEGNAISVWLWLLVASLVVMTACHRGYYRRMADAEAKELVNERNCDPRWSHPDGSLEIDAQSRMFDPFSQDHPPMPPDDETAHTYMHRVAGRKNYPHWHANGDTNYVENPEWLMYLPLNDQGEVVLDLDTVVELAFIHSPTFQRQREELYLSALDVALERFGFDSQLFAGMNPTFGTQGRFRPGGSQSNLGMSLGATGGGINYRKVGATGTTFVVGLANSILWNFAGPNTQSATSLINFSLIQPLMRNGGRERILASLTFAERNLLGNVRQFERFRQGFYLEVVIGRTGVPGISRGGSFLGTPPAATTNAGGFLGLLQSLQNIRIQEFNVRQLNDVAAQFEEFFQRGRINNALQVRQAQARMYSAQAQLMQSKVNYQNDLERFVRTLGFPPELEVVVQD
ncbi:MAG TPA: TolC family protein, partial [Pirellulaceae bacterium]|nr:TolC family protein [Pirellulaceae bacterium]